MADELKAKETKPVKKAKASKNKKPGVFKRIGTFLKEMKSELSKVVWPSLKQVVNNTMAVIVVIVLSSVFIGLIDWFFKFLINLLTI